MEELNTLKEIKNFDYYVIVDRSYERPESEDLEEGKECVTYKLESN